MTPPLHFMNFSQKSLKKCQNLHFPRGFWENHPISFYNDFKIAFYGFSPEVPTPCLFDPLTIKHKRVREKTDFIEN